MIYSNDPRVQILQKRYWDEIDDFIQTERNKEDIRHGTAANLALLKLKFLQKLVIEIKKMNKIDQKNMSKKIKSMPTNERQTIDVDEYANENIVLNKNKNRSPKPKSRYGSW
jgi:hypothetical protein